MSYFRIAKTDKGFAVLYVSDGLPVFGPLPSGLIGALVFDTESEAEEAAQATEGRFGVRFSRQASDGLRSWSSDSWTLRFLTPQSRDQWLATREALGFPEDENFEVTTF